MFIVYRPHFIQRQSESCVQTAVDRETLIKNKASFLPSSSWLIN